MHSPRVAGGQPKNLDDSDERSRVLLEALADGVFVAQDLHFVFANPTLPPALDEAPAREALRRRAHTPKGSAGAIGAASLCALAGELERAAAQGLPNLAALHQAA